MFLWSPRRRLTRAHRHPQARRAGLRRAGLPGPAGAIPRPPAPLAAAGRWPVTRLYRYVGPEDIRRRAATAPTGVRVGAVSDLEDWIRQTSQTPNRDSLIAATFVVD